jgi:ubiquinone/menaquinone biosynthesis C-methylase UbiE
LYPIARPSGRLPHAAAHRFRPALLRAPSREQEDNPRDAIRAIETDVMLADPSDEIAMQRAYYARTAADYDTMHLHAKDEHALAMTFMVGCMEHLEVQSLLDVGAGTGRVLSYVHAKLPSVRAIGIEPVQKLREVGYGKGIARTTLIDGDAYHLEFEDGQFDLVCEFGVLHHVRRPERVVSEMLRVAQTAIFISDSNNFGQGSALARVTKQVLDAMKLWPAFDRIKTRGKGYTVSEGDGLAYSYSVFNNYRQIAQQCQPVHLLNTRGGSRSPYRSASHVALLGIKRGAGPGGGTADKASGML